MATTIERHEYIDDRWPEEIFEAAMDPDTLPGDKFLIIEPVAKSLAEGRINMDTEFDVRLHMGVRMGILAVKHDFRIPSAVTEYEEAKRLLIVGSSEMAGGISVGDLSIALGLTHEKKQKRTRIDYSVIINHNTKLKWLEGPVAKHLGGKDGRLANYTGKYRDNVEARMDDLPLPYPRKSRHQAS